MNYIVDATLQGLLLALLPFFVSLFIDVCLGSPAAVNEMEEPKFNEKAIFFFWCYWLAKRRLVKYHIFHSTTEPYKEGLRNSKQMIVDNARSQMRRTVFATAKDFFTWEHGFGMCPVCTNIRVSLLFSIGFLFLPDSNAIATLLIPFISNFYLLFFNRLKN